MLRQYKITTTKISIYTWAANEKAAVETVMAVELCPLRSILSVGAVSQPVAI